jgi:DNA-binding MarR family transcriptional regulator
MTAAESIRHAIIGNLYPTRKIRVPLTRIRRDVSRETDATDSDIDTEVAFLVKAGLLDSQPDPVGSTQYYQLTAAGVLAHERA